MKNKDFFLENPSLTYEERVSNLRKKSSFSIAFFMCYRYIRQFKKLFFISVFSSILSVLFSILVIFGISNLTIYVGDYFNKTNSNNLSDILTLGLLLLGGYFLNALFNYIMNFFLVKVGQKIAFHLRMDLLNKLQLLKLEYFDTHESGDIMSVLANDVLNIVIFISQNFGILLFGITMMIGMIIVMFLVSPYLTLITIGIITLLTSYIVYMSNKSIPAFIKQQQELGKMNGYVEEIISGQNIVNLFKKEERTEFNFSEINNSLNKDAEKAQTISGLFIPFMSFLANFSLMIMTVIIILFIINGLPFGSDIFISPYNQDGTINITNAIAFVNMFSLALRNFIQPINNIVGMIASLQQALASSKRIADIFILDNEHLKTEINEISKLKGDVKISNLNFAYIPNKLVLKNINLSVESGQTIAIVGPTGSGKTTIINLLTKFYDIYDGDILLDNQSIKEMTKSSLRNQVSIVLQDTYLFNDSIKENIRYAKPDATDEEIIDVAKKANCDTFIRQLKNGYETILTENASELSQGQKQLIAIARAMLSTSSILILDEATSNIDTRTEKVVQDAMNKLISTKTAFVIAHRLSTIRNADKIVVLKDGEIIEIGNHNELLKQKGFYYKLSQSKSGSIDEEQ